MTHFLWMLIFTSKRFYFSLFDNYPFPFLCEDVSTSQFSQTRPINKHIMQSNITISIILFGHTNFMTAWQMSEMIVDNLEILAHSSTHEYTACLSFHTGMFQSRSAVIKFTSSYSYAMKKNVDSCWIKFSPPQISLINTNCPNSRNAEQSKINRKNYLLILDSTLFHTKGNKCFKNKTSH